MKDKIIAISGGASGIGLATSKLLSSLGATVCISDINTDALAEVQHSFEGFGHAYLIDTVDVSKRIEVDAWIGRIVEMYGRLDGAVNCAGIIGRHHGTKTVGELDDDERDKLIAINLTGMMYCMRAELRRIRDGGSIVCISSIQGIKSSPHHSAYSATKHGVIGLVRAAAAEYGRRGIRVNALAPGAIATPLMDQADRIHNRARSDHHEPSAIKRLGTAEEMAKSIAFLLGEDSSFTTGTTLVADGGWVF